MFEEKVLNLCARVYFAVGNVNATDVYQGIYRIKHNDFNISEF